MEREIAGAISSEVGHPRPVSGAAETARARGQVAAALAALKKVVYGTALLTPSIQAVAAALMRGRVPPTWAKKWEGPERPEAWLTLLASKAAAVAKWRLRRRAKKLTARLARRGTFETPSFARAGPSFSTRGPSIINDHALDDCPRQFPWHAYDASRVV